MKKTHPKRFREFTQFTSLFLFLFFFFSFQCFANTDIDCGDISGFEFSNGNSSVTIVNKAKYYIGDLPNNFYVDVIVAGYSQSARIKIRNINTGQEYIIGENYLPYTFPAGNGAWHIGVGTFEVKGSLYGENYCGGTKCDELIATFTLVAEQTVKGTAYKAITETVEIKQEVVKKNNIKLYPNPAVNDINVELSLLDNEVISYSALDLNGRQVLSGIIDNKTLGKTKINTTSLSNGLYIIKFSSNFRSFSKKIQVVK